MPLHIVVEIVPKGPAKTEIMTTESGREALDWLLAQNEKHKGASVRVTVEANNEPIVVLAGIAEMQERLAAPIQNAPVSHAEGRRHMRFAERQGVTERV